MDNTGCKFVHFKTMKHLANKKHIRAVDQLVHDCGLAFKGVEQNDFKLSVHQLRTYFSKTSGATLKDAASATRPKKIQGPVIQAITAYPPDKPEGKVEGNVHTGAIPPWMLDDQDNPPSPPPPIQSSAKPQQNSTAKTKDSGEDDNWLPNFGGVWEHGPRRETRENFRANKSKDPKKTRSNPDDSSWRSGHQNKRRKPVDDDEDDEDDTNGDATNGDGDYQAAGGGDNQAAAGDGTTPYGATLQYYTIGGFYGPVYPFGNQ